MRRPASVEHTCTNLAAQFTGATTRAAISLVFLALPLALISRSQDTQSLHWGQPTSTELLSQPQHIASHELPDAPRREPLQARRLTLGERFCLYKHSIANPESALGPALGAAVSQASDEPPEWGQGAGGYGTRLASGYGRLVINRTIRFGVAAIDHEDPRFTYSNESGFWRRFRYSSVHYVMARREDGGLMPAYSRFAGAYGAAFIANAWYPESRANTAHAMMRGSTSLLAGYAWNVFKEFWPDIKRAIHHPKAEEAADLEVRDPRN